MNARKVKNLYCVRQCQMSNNDIPTNWWWWQEYNNGEKTISLTSGARKTGQPLVKQ